MNAFFPQLINAFKRIFASPLAGFMSILVIGIALSLPAGLYVMLKNASGLLAQLASAPQINLFLKLNTTPQQIETLQQQLTQHAGIAKVEWITREAALQQMSQATGVSDVVAGLAQNPLPDTLVITPKNGSAQAVDMLQRELAGVVQVELAQLDASWAYRLEAILNVGRIAIAVLATLLSLALIAITFNTIRLQILTQRDEIEVSKLIGATNAFIRRPFLYFGAVQGFFGGLVALLIISIALHLLNLELAVLAKLYASEFVLAPLSLGDSFSLLLFSMYLGLLGAWLSVLRHLSRIEPN